MSKPPKPPKPDKPAQPIDELRWFQAHNPWPGGYREGNPLDPGSRSTYGDLGYMSVLHATYLACIKPFVGPETVALEIGPGRGAWTRTLLPAREVWCLDAISAVENGFWTHVGAHDHVRYVQVHDFACDMLLDDHFDYFITFGCFCHLTFEAITAYMTHLFPKFQRGAQGFMMIADYEQYNGALGRREKWGVFSRVIPPSRPELRAQVRELSNGRLFGTMPPMVDRDLEPAPRRWYDAGVRRTCRMLHDVGYRIVDPDVGTLLRDPIIHFVKP